MAIDMKLGFIGCGNMAAAILRGVVSSGLVQGSDIMLFDVQKDKTEALCGCYGATPAESASQVAESCRRVVLAVKPQVFASLLPDLSDSLKKNDPLIISIAAGKTLSFIEGLLDYKPALVRVMPNINATVLAAVSAYCQNERVSGEQLLEVKAFCESFGTAVQLEESFFPVFGVIGGCSPAFAYMFIDAMARAAVKNGMPKSTALQVCAQAALGSAKLILEGDDSPWNLVDKVCSPGGTTIEGVLSLQRDGFEAAVANAVQAAVEKDKKV